MTGILFFGSVLILVIVLSYFYFRALARDKQKAKEIYVQYQQVLADGDRKRALELGREYYKTLRGGALTIYDEQALANDLSTIPLN